MAGHCDAVLAQVLHLQIRLYACRERLAAATDEEALHDLRIAVRTLRSLFKPLAGLAACAAVQQRAAELGRASGPLRDAQVLQQELARQGQAAASRARQAQLQPGYLALLSGPRLPALFVALDEFPECWRQAKTNGELRRLGKRISRRLAKHRRALVAALVDPDYDRHRLRLLIKRLRYGAEVYPALAGLSPAEHAELKQAQSALGDWHDHLQWLLRAEHERDLAPCAAYWRQALQAAERQADCALLALRRRFADED
nr:CHAD domain-containing protein [uncultured Pseudomonas sp.]